MFGLEGREEISPLVELISSSCRPRLLLRFFLRLVAGKIAKQFGDSCRLLREQDGWIAFHRRVFLQIPEICNRCFFKFIPIVLFFLAGRFVSVMKLFQLFAKKFRPIEIEVSHV
jgi:hypothetical protein